MLAQFRQTDRQPPPEELIETNPEIKPPDYQAMRDRVLKSLLSGRGKVATTSPQYKTAAKVLDRFIEELKSTPISTPISTQEQINTPESQATWESRSETFLEEVNWNE